MELSALGEFLSKIFHFENEKFEEKRKRITLLDITMLTLSGGLVWCFMFAFLGDFFSSIAVFLYVVCTLFNLIYYYFSSNYVFFRAFQIVLILILPVANQFVLGGFTNSGATAFTAFYAPIGALIFLRIKDARKLFYGFVISLLLISTYEFLVWDSDYKVTRQFSIVLFMFSGLSLLTITYFVLESFVSKLNKYQAELILEKEKSESLLLNILPESVAQELKESGLSKAKGFASATVVFTDFVQFTTSAQMLTPGKLVENLDVYFRSFDKIMEKYGLEKIKTIGDSYLYAGGIPVEKHSHAIDAILAALEIQKEVELIAKSGVVSFPYKLRLGIHSGPLVAGVVGQKKFAYDIWGDTVNIAARIEQNGIPGEVLISAHTHRLVNNHFNCTTRGEIEAKNMGTIKIFTVDSLKS